MAIERTHPTRSLATSLIDLKGDINISAAGSRFLATKQAGLEPIERPNKIKSFSETPSF